MELPTLLGLVPFIGGEYTITIPNHAAQNCLTAFVQYEIGLARASFGFSPSMRLAIFPPKKS